MNIIHEKIQPDSAMYTDSCRVHFALDGSEFHHHRIDHSEIYTAVKIYLNGIQKF